MRVFQKAAMVGGFAAATMALSATAAMASVVTVGGSSTTPTVENVTGTNSGAITFESNFGVPMDCTTSALTGKVNNGTTIVNGAQIGEVDTLSFTDCTATSLGFDVTVSNSGNVYPIVATGAPNSDGTVPIKIVGITASVSGTQCSFGATADEVDGTFTPGTSASAAGTIEIDTTGDFPLSLSVAGGGSTCGGQIFDGDTADMTGTFALSDDDGAISHT